MRFYVISDNIDTLMGMRLAGIEGIVVHEKEEVLQSLADVMKQGDNDNQINSIMSRNHITL